MIQISGENAAGDGFYTATRKKQGRLLLVIGLLTVGGQGIDV